MNIKSKARDQGEDANNKLHQRRIHMSGTVLDANIEYDAVTTSVLVFVWE